ncbi:MAG: CARDB domain-containing protein [archaeon]|jgi:hypothetical protein
MKRKNYLLGVLLLLIIFAPLCSAAHYIVGVVEDAKDGTEANGNPIILWNPIIGIEDNLSDVIGPTGNSSINNSYRIDCEFLNVPCEAEDILSLKVMNNSNGYISETINITLSENDEDTAMNIILNSPPTTELIYPESFFNSSDTNIEFNCSALDLDENIKKIELYGNWTGEWALNETKEISYIETFEIFTKILSEGFYKWGCKATDNLSTSSFSNKNNTLIVDLTKPIIESVLGNITSSCGESNIIRVVCTTYENLSGIDKVIIQSISPYQTINYSTSVLAEEEYFADIPLNEIGEWTFNCIVNNSAGNINNLISEEVQVYSNLPDLSINYQNINLSKLNPIENESININSIIENLGCSNAENALISFFEGDPEESGINIGNTIINISNLSFVQINISWNTKIGPNNIFVFADYNFLINEESETNNKENRTISINSWQDIYGNTSVDKIIGGVMLNITKWFNESSLEGNIFVADSESYINWISLQAIGKSQSGGESNNDFSEIDELLGMTSFEDSVYNIFSNSGNPKATKELIIHSKEISEVPVINSTNNSNFLTGILWDYSDDYGDGEFDSTDKEDLVFVAPIKKYAEGAYGYYDYEIRIPSKLREYNNFNNEEIYLYYNLN